MQESLMVQHILRLTQGENTSGKDASHQKSYAMDLGGVNTGAAGSVDKAYAPYDGRVVRADGLNNNAMFIESLEPVVGPSGKVDYQRHVLIHTNRYILKAGDTFKQGQHIYTEGTAGGVTAHIHIEGGYGKWSSVGGAKLSQNSAGTWTIANQAHLYDMMYLPADCKIQASGGYPWKFATSDTENKPTTSEGDDMKARLYRKLDETARTSELVARGYERAMTRENGQRVLLSVVAASEVDASNISSVIDGWERGGKFTDGTFVIVTE